MDRARKGVSDPAVHRASKTEMEEDVGLGALPEALAWAVTRGGAKRCEKQKEVR